MIISKSQYQLARQSTRNKCLVEKSWHTYYNVDFYKNYFIEDELEFLKALKQDLEQQLKETKENIKKLEKTHQN